MISLHLARTPPGLTCSNHAITHQELAKVIADYAALKGLAGGEGTAMREAPNYN